VNAAVKVSRGLLLATALLTACSPGDKPVADHKPDPEIVGKLEEIVKLRQRELETEQIRTETGESSDDGAARLALANARMTLARELGQQDAVVTELRNLVKSYQQALDRAKALAEEDRRTLSDLSQLRVRLLDAEIQLRREELNQKSNE